MKILIKIHRSPEQCYLVEISNVTVLNRIQKLINKGKHSNAIVAAFLNSESLQEINVQNLSDIGADLILTEKHLHYDLL